MTSGGTNWFVVGRLSIDRSIQLNHYNYLSMSSVYMLTRGEEMAKKEFFVRKPTRNLKGFWTKKTKKKSERIQVQVGHNWCDR